MYYCINTVPGSVVVNASTSSSKGVCPINLMVILIPSIAFHWPGKTQSGLTLLRKNEAFYSITV